MKTTLLFFTLLSVICLTTAAAKDKDKDLLQTPVPYVYRPTSVLPGDPFWYCGPGLAYEKAWTPDYLYWYCIVPYYSPYYTGWWYPRYKRKGYYKYPAKGYRYDYGKRKWRRPNRTNRGETKGDLTAPDFGSPINVDVDVSTAMSTLLLSASIQARQ